MLLFLLSLVMIYGGHIFYNIAVNVLKRRNIKAGDLCKVYVGEVKLPGMILKSNNELEIWVAGKIIRFARNDIYA